MNRRKKFVSLFLVFSLLVLTGNLFAKKKGAELIVQKKESQRIKGELIAVKENSLLLLDRERADVLVNISDISAITIKKSETLVIGLAGLILGAAIGYIVGQGQVSNKGWAIVTKETAGGIGAAIGGAIGVLAGFSVPSSVGIGHKKIQIEEKSPEEVKEVLEKLRKKARIPDYE